jgi:dCMP deaminase
MAALVASWSKDPSTKVGCVLVDPRLHRVVGTGFNGLPHGVDDRPELLISREEKLAFTIHAEENALIYARQSARGMTCYITHPPCSTCAVKLIQAGIDRVVVIAPKVSSNGEDFGDRWAASLERAKTILGEAGVSYDVLHVDEECECSSNDRYRTILQVLSTKLTFMGNSLLHTARTMQGTQAACRDTGTVLKNWSAEIDNSLRQEKART